MSGPIRLLACVTTTSLAIAACDTGTAPEATGPAAGVETSAIKFWEVGATPLQVASAVIPVASLPQTNVTITVFVHHLPDGSPQGTWTAARRLYRPGNGRMDGLRHPGWSSNLFRWTRVREGNLEQ